MNTLNICAIADVTTGSEIAKCDASVMIECKVEHGSRGSCCRLVVRAF